MCEIKVRTNDRRGRIVRRGRRGRKRGGGGGGGLLLHILNLITQELHIIYHGLIILVLKLLVVAELLSRICY